MTEVFVCLQLGAALGMAVVMEVISVLVLLVAVVGNGVAQRWVWFPIADRKYSVCC